MKRRVLSILLALAMCLALLPGAAVALADGEEFFPPWDGAGTEDDPYVIWYDTELFALAQAVNDGTDFAGVYFQLWRDLDISDEAWEPIGRWDSETGDARPFSGVFDGDGCSIRYEAEDPVPGLFGCNFGVIKNLTVKGSIENDINGGPLAGGVCGYNDGLIFNCEARMDDLSAQRYAGGICAVNGENGVIENCRNTGGEVFLFREEGTGPGVGGICGFNLGAVRGCYNTADVFDYGRPDPLAAACAGGICGVSAGVIENCYNTGDVSGYGMAGGICGTNGKYGNGTGDGPADFYPLTHCYNTGEVTSGRSDAPAGGICGEVGIPGKSVCTDCFYLEGTGALSGTAVTPQQLSAPATFSGWDDALWEMGALYAVSGGQAVRPVLKANPEFLTLGHGSWADPYRIADARMLAAVRDLINCDEDFAKAAYVLTADIDLSELCGPELGSWTPIGSAGTLARQGDFPFNGTFDGGGHTISGLYIAAPGLDELFPGEDEDVYERAASPYLSIHSLSGGLFGRCEEDSLIFDLNVEGDVSGVVEVGGICIQNMGWISNCTFSGTVTGMLMTGGICATNEDEGVLEDCALVGGQVRSLTTPSLAQADGLAALGGVCGINSGEMDSCFTGADTVVDGIDTIAGGVCGFNLGVLYDSTARGQVRIDQRYTERAFGGGVCGANAGVLTRCENTGAVTGQSPAVRALGGICGYAPGRMTNRASEISMVQNSGPVTSLGGYAGGVAGLSSTAVEYACNTGAVSALDYVGGICGSCVERFSAGAVRHSYNTGKITATAEAAACGGLCGDLPSGEESASACSFYLDTCGAAGMGQTVTAAQVASGELAWMLQDGQESSAWGQDLAARETRPALGSQRVYRLTGKRMDSGETVSYSYVNADGSHTLPKAPSVPGYSFSKWVAAPDPKAPAFTRTYRVTEDTVLYAVMSKSASASRVTDRTRPPEPGSDAASGEGQSGADSAFTDVAAGDWFASAVDFCVKAGLMQGTSGAIFSPGVPTTRAMVMTMLARRAGVDTSGGESWFEAGMTWAVENHISDGTDPQGIITREQLAAMLCRAVKAVPGSDADAVLRDFSDGHWVSDWAVEAVAWAVETGLLTGKPGKLLDPQGQATRAEVAVLFTRLASLPG